MSVDRDLAVPGGGARPAEHALGAEVHDDAALAVDRNESAIAAEPAQDVMQQLVYCLGERQAAVLDRRAHVVGGDYADEVLAMPGGGYRTHAILRVGAGADDGRIADPSRALVGHAAGGGGGGAI